MSASAVAIERPALWLAEDAARELPNLPLQDAWSSSISTLSVGGRSSSRQQLAHSLSQRMARRAAGVANVTARLAGLED